MSVALSRSRRLMHLSSIVNLLLCFRLPSSRLSYRAPCALPVAKLELCSRPQFSTQNTRGTLTGTRTRTNNERNFTCQALADPFKILSCVRGCRSLQLYILKKKIELVWRDKSRDFFFWYPGSLKWYSPPKINIPSNLFRIFRCVWMNSHFNAPGY